MNQILISAMWEVVMTSDLTHTLTRPLSQSVIMMTANGHIHKFIKNTEQISSCRILIKIRAYISQSFLEINSIFFHLINKGLRINF